MTPTLVWPVVESILRSTILVPLSLDEISLDRLFAQRPACFEAMQTVYEDEAVTIAPNQDGCLLSNFQHTLRNLLDCVRFERCATFDRHVDVRDRKFFLASS
jgi:hypothetical protein